MIPPQQENENLISRNTSPHSQTRGETPILKNVFGVNGSNFVERLVTTSYVSNPSAPPVTTTASPTNNITIMKTILPEAPIYDWSKKSSQFDLKLPFTLAKPSSSSSLYADAHGDASVAPSAEATLTEMIHEDLGWYEVSPYATTKPPVEAVSSASGSSILAYSVASENEYGMVVSSVGEGYDWNKSIYGAAEFINSPTESQELKTFTPPLIDGVKTKFLNNDMNVVKKTEPEV